jgi:hypothetical protein
MKLKPRARRPAVLVVMREHVGRGVLAADEPRVADLRGAFVRGDVPLVRVRCHRAKHIYG